MVNIVCGACGSENLTRDPDGPRASDIPLLCLDCGWRGQRTPVLSCSRCGSPDVEQVGVDGWAFGDLEDARDNPETAEWGYVDKTMFRCRTCRNEWLTAGEYRPHQQGDGQNQTFRV